MTTFMTHETPSREPSAASIATAPSHEGQMRSIERELARRFPDACPGHIHSLVEDAELSFAGARIWDFVPLLVRRRVAERLAHPIAVSEDAAPRT